MSLFQSHFIPDFSENDFAKEFDKIKIYIIFFFFLIHGFVVKKLEPPMEIGPIVEFSLTSLLKALRIYTEVLLVSICYVTTHYIIYNQYDGDYCTNYKACTRITFVVLKICSRQEK